MGELHEQTGEYSKAMYFYDIVEVTGELLMTENID